MIIPLSQDRFTVIDDDDFKFVVGYTWYAAKNGRTYYAQTHVKDGAVWRTVKLHQLLLPDAVKVDHIDGNGLNNSRSNLRTATTAQNGANRKKDKRPTSSKFKGVSWHRPKSIWISRIKVAGKGCHLGYFASEEEAARAYDKAAIMYFGEYAHLNFPQEKP